MRILTAAFVVLMLAAPAIARVEMKKRSAPFFVNDFVVTCVEQLPKLHKGWCWQSALQYEKPGPYFASEYRGLPCEKISPRVLVEILKGWREPDGQWIKPGKPTDLPAVLWPDDRSPTICGQTDSSR